MDEYRVSNISRYGGSKFSVPTEAYTLEAQCKILVGAIRPLSGIKMYIGTANTTAGTLTVNYRDSNGGWSACTTVSDGTAGTVPLDQTGTITFDSTVDLCYPSAIDEQVLYWYLITITGPPDTTTTISQCTGVAPFQSLTDLWDGKFREILACERWIDEHNRSADYTIQVLDIDYDGSDGSSLLEATAMSLNDMATTDFILCGFSEQLMGLKITMAGDLTNGLPCTMNVAHWSGDSSDS